MRLPVLRKDFIVEEYQIYESVAAGADALLLIVAALSDEDLRGSLKLCHDLQIAPLVEVHDESELQRALAAGAKIIGVNNRNLKTLEVNLETSLRLRAGIPGGIIAVSESGIKTPEDLRRVAEADLDEVGPIARRGLEPRPLHRSRPPRLSHRSVRSDKLKHWSRQSGVTGLSAGGQRRGAASSHRARNWRFSRSNQAVRMLTGLARATPSSE